MRPRWRKRHDSSVKVGPAPIEFYPIKFEIHWNEAYVSRLFSHTVEGMQNLLRNRIFLRIKSSLGGRTVACAFIALATVYKKVGVWGLVS